MDKFFTVLLLTIIFSLTYAGMVLFESKSSAATFKQGIELYVKAPHKVNRSPSVMPKNRE